MDSVDTKNLTQLFKDAKDIGVSLEQLARFRAGGYWPQRKQLFFHAHCREADLTGGPEEVGFGGSRGPGKSHALLAQIALDDCQLYPGLKCLLLRKIGKAVRESFEDLRLRVLNRIPHHYNRSSGTLTFPNDSRIILGHFKDEKDVDSYLGLEYDEIGVEEATTLSSKKYNTIRTCCRTSKHGWRPRTYSNGNPGGVGHAWYKARFITPFLTNKQNGTRFTLATYRDNAFLNPEYVNTLNALTGWRLRAWRDADWDIAAGQYFVTFDRGVHVITPVPVPDWYPEAWLALDYGWTHPTAVLLFAKDNQDNVIVIDEYSASKRLPSVHSAMIREMLDRWSIREERIRLFPFGRDAYQKDQEGRTVVDSYEVEGWDPEPANMARISGAMEILKRLGDADAGVKPSLFIYENCTGLIETLPRMEHDPHRPEDVLKCSVDDEGIGGDDYYDCLRYGLMAVRESAPMTFEVLRIPGG